MTIFVNTPVSRDVHVAGEIGLHPAFQDAHPLLSEREDLPLLGRWNSRAHHVQSWTRPCQLGDPAHRPRKFPCVRSVTPRRC